MMVDEIPKTKYECVITVKLPGQTRPTGYKIPVDAYDNMLAVRAAQDVWRKCVEPRDVHVKVIEDVIEA